MKCPACNERDASAVTYGLCDSCIEDVYVGSDDAARVVEELTDRIAQVHHSREKAEALAAERHTRIIELEEELISAKTQLAASAMFA